MLKDCQKLNHHIKPHQTHTTGIDTVDLDSKLNLEPTHLHVFIRLTCICIQCIFYSTIRKSMMFQKEYHAVLISKVIIKKFYGWQTAQTWGHNWLNSSLLLSMGRGITWLSSPRINLAHFLGHGSHKEKAAWLGRVLDMGEKQKPQAFSEGPCFTSSRFTGGVCGRSDGHKLAPMT